MPFYDRLVGETRDDLRQTITTPELEAALNGNISIQAYVEYLTRTYHYVRSMIPLMRLAEHRLEHRPVLADALRAYIQEEAGHEQRVLEEIEAVGGDPSIAVGSTPSGTTQAMIDHAGDMVRDRNATSIFGEIFAIDTISAAIADKAIHAMITGAGCSDDFFPDLCLDVQAHHRERSLVDLLNQIDDPDDQRAIVTMAHDMYRLFGAIFTDLPIGEFDSKPALKEDRLCS